MKQIAIHTFKTLLREKIIFNVFGVTILLLFFGYLASLLVYGHQDRVMLDMGILMNALSVFAVAMGVGARFLRQEMESKTVYLFLVRPLSRSQFYLGRFLGMSFFLFLNFFILTMILWAAVAWMSGTVSPAFFQSFFLTYLEALILMAGSLVASFWLRPALVLMLMLALLFLGHNHQLIQSLQSEMMFLNHFSPNFSLFLMSDRVYYAQALEWRQFINITFYGIFWLFFFLLLGNAVFSRKNL